METGIIRSEIKETDSKQLIEKIRTDFIGLNTKYRIANGGETRRIYLDSTASTLMMGMVRVSFGIYNTILDVDHFIHALKDIISKQDEYAKHYTINEQGDYEHITFQFSCKDYFSLSENVRNELNL